MGLPGFTAEKAFDRAGTQYRSPSNRVVSRRAIDVVEKHFLRVDVTEEFPFLVTRLSSYDDR
jgi:hypothetical protein